MLLLLQQPLYSVLVPPAVRLAVPLYRRTAVPLYCTSVPPYCWTTDCVAGTSWTWTGTAGECRENQGLERADQPTD